ncbi:UNVERIFIED_CONTAM: protein OCTOPUS-like [Sesamum calycinum]|uniref:Protein OCTOPUS-like n=1 Tax=Sesamum calycinum TaxID=2727403 RepID=A0AAW2MZZ9_9LAMI
MVSVMEDAPAAHVTRSDMQIPVEEPTSNCANEGEGVPGGTTQTREYYSDSSSRRRKSLDRLFSWGKSDGGERDLRDSSSHSLRDDCSETFELGSGFRDSSSSVIGNGERKEPKKSRRWSWRIWGFIQRRNGGNKDEEEEEKYSRVNGVERSLSESWQDLRREGNGDVRGGHNRSVEMNGHGKKKRDDFMLEKNRSARYSPNHVDNGLLRFYLTPMRSSRRGGLGKIKPNNSHSIARSVLRLY